MGEGGLCPSSGDQTLPTVPLVTSRWPQRSCQTPLHEAIPVLPPGPLLLRRRAWRLWLLVNTMSFGVLRAGGERTNPTRCTVGSLALCLLTAVVSGEIDYTGVSVSHESPGETNLTLTFPPNSSPVRAIVSGVVRLYPFRVQTVSKVSSSSGRFQLAL